MAIKFLSALNLSNVTAGSILKLDSNGDIVAATAGTDYATSSVWTTSGSNIYYSSGNVTIGASSNSAPLHVYAYQTTDPKFLIEDGNTGDASMQFKISAQQWTVGLDNSDSDKFKISAGSTFTTTDFQLDTNGRLGIGTAPVAGYSITTGGKMQSSLAMVVSGVETGNPQPAANHAHLSGYGIIGNRGTFYVTNNGTVQIGNGTTHNANPAASFTSTSISLKRSTDITSADYIDLKINQTDSAAIKMGVSSGTTEGFIMTETTGGSHLSTDPVLKFLYNDGTVTEYARFKTEGLDITGRLDVASDLRLRGSSSNNDLGVVRLYTSAGNHLFIDTGNNGGQVAKFAADGSLTLDSSNSQGLTVKQSASLGADMQVEIRGSRNAPGVGVNPAKLVLSSFDSDDGNGVVKTGAEFYMESTSLTGGDLTDFEVGLRYRKDGSVVDGLSIHDGEVKAHGYLTVTGSEINMPSGAQLDWANGDARIIEGAVSNYSLSFQTYTGSALTTKMFISSGGNIGMGTTSPNHKLDIYSNENVPLRIHRPNNANLDSSGAWGIGFSTRGDGNNSTTDTRAGIFSYYNGNLFLATNNTSIVGDPDAYARLTILSTGSVGIGTMNPGTDLEIGNGTGNVGLTLNKSTTGEATLFFDNAGNNKNWIKANSAEALQFATNNSVNVTIEEGGNIGMGTTSPSAKLHVSGGNILVDAQYGIRFVDANTRIYTNSDSPEDLIVEADQNLHLNPDGSILAQSSISMEGGSIITTDSNNALVLRSDVQHGQGDEDAVISFKQSTTEHAKIDQSGYMYATGFKTTTASTGFLKADGTVESVTFGTMASETASDYYDSDAVETYVAQELGSYLPLAGGEMTGPLKITEGANDQTNSSDTTSLPSTTGAEFMRIQGNYTDGRYTHEWAKIDRGGNLPLYLRESKGTANSFSNLARFGNHSNSNYEFEVFGDINATGNLYDGGNPVWHSGNDGSGSGLDADFVDGLHSSSFIRSDASDSASGDITFSGKVTFTGGATETSNKSTLFSDGNFVQFAHQPLSRMWGNECLWADRKHSVSTTGTISSANNVFRTGDNYAYFQAATDGANPVEWVIEGTFSATTNVNARRVVIFAHGGFNCDLRIQIKNDDGTWETIFDGDYTFSGSRWHFFALTPEITYPDDWSITGIRVRFDNYGAGSNRYVGQIGITNVKDHDTFPYISQGGGRLYDNSTLSFGNSDDLQIYHNGTHSYIKDAGTGSLYIQGTSSVQIESASGENMAVFTADGSSELYYNNVKKFNTTAAGGTVSGALTITQAGTNVLSLFNTTNANGVAIEMSDQTGGAQKGYITFRHSDGQSQGGGTSFHFTANQPDVTLVVGDSTNKGRFVAYSANTTSEVDYGFADDVNTGMYSPASNQLGLVVNGSRKLFGTANGIEIQNGRLYLSTVDSNTTSTSALVLNGTEVEQRTLGSAAFVATSTFATSAQGTTADNALARSGGTMTGDLRVTNGDNNGIRFHSGGANITSVSSGDIVIQRLSQLRLGDATNWDWNKWAGIMYNSTSEVLYIGGPSASQFSSNSNPPSIDVDFVGVDTVNTPDLNVTGLVDTSSRIATGGQITVNNRTAISVGQWAASSNSTGAIRITLPGSHSSNWSMIVLRITAYEYNSTAHTIYYVSGHDWTSGWYNNGVTKIGNSNKNIKLGYDSNKDYVILGGVTDTWSYGHVTVDVMAHPSFYSSAMDITSGWDVRQVTDLTGITTQSVTNKRVLTTSDEGSGNGIDADTVDGLQASSFLRSDTSDEMSGTLTMRNNVSADGTIIRDINFNTSAANGTDDRVALIRARTQGGTSTTRGGRLSFYTRNAGGNTFHESYMNHQGDFYFANNLYASSNKVATESWVTSQSYATLASPALTGTPTAPTAAAGTNTTQIATTAFVSTAVSDLVDSAPDALNTLNELAAAIGDDANFSTTITNSIAAKLPLAGGTMTGSLTLGSNTNEKDFKVFGNDSGEYLLWDGSESRLDIYHDTDDAGLRIFTVGSAQPTSAQLKIGRDSGQYWGVRTDDSTAYLIHRQDETGGSTHQTRFELWSSATGVASWQWWKHDNAGANANQKMKLTDDAELTLGGGTNTITNAKVGNWDTAYGWGNHANGGYASSSHTHTSLSGTTNDVITLTSTKQTDQGSSDPVIDFVYGTTSMGKFDASGYLYAAGFKTSGTVGFLRSDGTVDTNSYANAANFLALSGGTMTGDLTIPSKIIHSGDTNTYFQFNTDEIALSVGGASGIDITTTAVTSYKDFVVAGGETLSLGQRAEGDDNGRTVLIEGAANGSSGEGSGRIFFTEHNSTSASADKYGLSLYYEGDPNVQLPSGFQPNTGNATWSLRRHNNSVNGTAIMSGSRSSNNVLFGGGITTSGVINVPEYIYHSGDSNTYVRFTADRIRIVAGGSTKFDSSSTYLVSGTDISVRNITARDIVSSADRTYNLGTDANRWAVVFCETLDSAGQHESNLQDKEKPISQYETGTVLSWKDGKNRPCTQYADHMRMGIAVHGQDSPLIQGAEPVLCTGIVEEGDYLVTSDKVGHAVAVPRNIVKEQMLFDCVIGKALENGDGESHLIKTWINI